MGATPANAAFPKVVLDPVAAMPAAAVSVAVPEVEVWPAGEMPKPIAHEPDVEPEPLATSPASALSVAAPVVWATPLTYRAKVALPLVEAEPAAAMPALAVIAAAPDVDALPVASSGKPGSMAAAPDVVALPAAVSGKLAVPKNAVPAVCVTPAEASEPWLLTDYARRGRRAGRGEACCGRHGACAARAGAAACWRCQQRDAWHVTGRLGGARGRKTGGARNRGAARGTGRARAAEVVARSRVTGPPLVLDAPAARSVKDVAPEVEVEPVAARPAAAVTAAPAMCSSRQCRRRAPACC